MKVSAILHILLYSLHFLSAYVFDWITKKLCYIIESLGQYQCNESVRAAGLVASWSLWNVAWNKSAAQTSQRMFIKFNSEQRKQTVVYLSAESQWFIFCWPFQNWQFTKSTVMYHPRLLWLSKTKLKTLLILICSFNLFYVFYNCCPFWFFLL